jgi:hypothetical protein
MAERIVIHAALHGEGWRDIETEVPNVVRDASVDDRAIWLFERVAFLLGGPCRTLIWEPIA